MRVNLTYSVSLDEVETQVAELIDKSGHKTKKLSVALERIANLLKGKQSNGVVMELDQIRRELNSLDLRLADCMSIMRSYNQTVQQLSEPEYEIDKEVENDEEG